MSGTGLSGAGVRGHGASILVATVSSTFGVVLLQVTNALGVAIRGDDVTGGSETVAAMLVIAVVVFMSVAIYVSAIVTSNTFATIIAGRTRTIALMRLIGSSAASQRRAVAKEGLLVGVAGSLAGAVIGTVLAVALVRVAVTMGVLGGDLRFNYADPIIVLPILAVIVTTWLASWVGSRRVLSVSPMQAIGGAEERSFEAATSRSRTVTAMVLMGLGTVFLGAGIVVGLVNPLGVLIALIGGIVSFTGLVLGSHLFIPPALRLVGRMLGSSAPARLAAENALRYPERSSRTTIGVVIAVTLITMFSVAVQSYRQLIVAAQQAQPEVYEGIEEMLTVTAAVFSVLIGFSALIAAIGLVSNLSLSVLQRTRELGLLRALGFTTAQLRGMIRIESLQLSVTAVLLGLVLGIAYGWAGAQSMLGSINGSPGLIAPAVPWLLVAAIVVAAGILTWVAARVPARRASALSPVQALAVD